MKTKTMKIEVPEDTRKERVYRTLAEEEIRNTLWERKQEMTANNLDKELKEHYKEKKEKYRKREQFYWDKADEILGKNMFTEEGDNQ